MADLKTFRTRNRAEAYRRRQSQALGYPKEAVPVNGGLHVKASDKVPCVNHMGLLRKSAGEWGVRVDEATRAKEGVTTTLYTRGAPLDADSDATTHDDDDWEEAPPEAKRRKTDRELMLAIDAEPARRTR